MDMKLAYLTETYESISDYDFIVSSTVSYRDWLSVMNFYSSEGTHVRTVTPRLIWTLEIVGKKEDNIQSIRRRIGATKGLELFNGDAHIKETRDAVASLVALLNGKKAPSGTLPVIVDPLLTGIFAHEAVGHAAEADLIMMGDSCFDGMLNKQIGSDIVTIKDDATIPGEFGSYVFDDEGVQTRPKPLIEDGYLRDYILSRETAMKYGLEPNGGARAESYHGRPLVRMSNTYVDKGDATFKEMMEDMKLGVYVKGSRGGQVNTSQGFFQFNAQESYLIENGQITKPLRDVSLSGRTLEILKLIDMVGRDLTLGYCGFCGKGQTVPVGQGGPHIRISKCVVGGQ
jgi:TldD protein